MKKILSFLLAAAVAASMGVTAFAKSSDESADQLYVFGAIVNRDENRAYIGVVDNQEYLRYAANGDIPGALEALKMDDVKLSDLKVKAKITEGKQYVGYTGFGDLNGLQFIVVAYGNDMNIDTKQQMNLELKVTNKNGKTVMDETKFRIKLDDSKFVIDEKDLGDVDGNGTAYGEWDQNSKEASVDLDALNANREIVEDMNAMQLAELGKFLAQGKVTNQGKINEYETLKEIPYNFLRVVDFDKAEEIELEADMFCYTTSAAKQGKVSLAYNNKAIPAVEALFSEEADLSFFSFPGRPEFDFTGKAAITLPDEDVEWFLYQINPLDGSIAPVSNAVLNEDGDGLEFKTRILGTYVLSDEALQLPSQKEDGAAGEIEAAPEMEDAAKENPSTGF